MRTLGFVVTTSLAVGAALALSACSKPSSDASSATDTSAANANAAASADATTPAAPSPTAIKLDIKDASGAPVSGDPVSGKAVFAQCMTCHSKEPGVNLVGPSLHGIIGRHSGIAPGFNYSTANKSSGLVWTEQELYTYLENPQKTVPGTYMTYTARLGPLFTI
jgi:cytochrome c